MPQKNNVTNKPKNKERRDAVANLYITIRMQGVGWNSTRGPIEEDYKALCETIAQAIKKDSRFVDGGKTVSIQIRGYDPTVKGLLVRDGLVIDG